MRVRFGSYIGNATGGRVIVGVGFKPKVLIIKCAANIAVWTADVMIGTGAMEFAGTPTINATWITSLDDDGFTVGSDNRVNQSGETVYWMAFADDGRSDIHTVSYTGNSTDNRSLTGFGFQPTLAWTGRSGAGLVIRYGNVAGDNAQGTTAALAANFIQVFEADGVQLGNSTNVNATGNTYYLVAFKDNEFLTQGQYTGNSTDDRDITVSGFVPGMTWIKNQAATVMMFKPRVVDDPNSLRIDSAVAPTTDIKALLAAAFRVGTSARVNLTGDTYNWATWRESRRLFVS